MTCYRSLYGGSNNATIEFVNLLDTNAIDIDRAPFATFDYNETKSGVDDRGGEKGVEEIDEVAYEQSQTKGRKSQRSKNYTILEDQILIKPWGAVSLDACTYVSNRQEVLAKDRRSILPHDGKVSQ